MSPRVLALMTEHLQGAYPEEGCGVLLGRDAEGVRVAEDAIPFSNASPETRLNRYVISPEQFLQADRAARERGLDVIGVFHSHPDHPAQPSGFDLEHAWPYYSYVIASVWRGVVADVRCWRLTDDRSALDAEPLEIQPATEPSNIGNETS